jgi:hypothetical protein
MIAAHLIIHTATVYTPTYDMDRNPILGPGAEVPCRIVPKNARGMVDVGATPEDTYIMLANTELTTGQKVKWGTKDLEIRKAWPCYALDGEHPDHWKAELV